MASTVSLSDKLATALKLKLWLSKSELSIMDSDELFVYEKRIDPASDPLSTETEVMLRTADLKKFSTLFGCALYALFVPSK